MLVMVLMVLGCGTTEPTPTPAVECPPTVECPAVDTTRMGALAFSLARCQLSEKKPVDFPPADFWETCEAVYAESCDTPEGIRQATAAGAGGLLPCRDTLDKTAAFGDSTK